MARAYLIMLSNDKPKPNKCRKCPKMLEPIYIWKAWVRAEICNDCMEKEMRELEALAEKRKKEFMVKLLALPPRFQTANFKEFKKELQPMAYKVAGRFAVEYMKTKPTKGLYFYGQPGSGKTHLMAAIANYLIPKENVRFITAPELLLQIRKSFNTTTNEEGLLDQLSRAKLLIIDDLGSEKPTEWVQETLFVLIDRRYTNYLPTLFTSNFSLDQLKDRLGYRIASRIAEMSDVVELKENDYRIRKTK